MEKELECKLLLEDVEGLKQQLIQKGARKIADEKQINQVFDSKAHPIQQASYLRIRQVEDLQDKSYHAEITFKKKVVNKEIREYHEFTTRIGSAKNMCDILRELGYDLVHQGQKHRISYAYQNARFDFDYWDKATYPNPYVEIEVKEKKQLEELFSEFKIPKEQVSYLSITELRKKLFQNNDVGYKE